MGMAGPDRGRGSTRQVTTATPAKLDFRASRPADEGCADAMSAKSTASVERTPRCFNEPKQSALRSSAQGPSILVAWRWRAYGGRVEPFRRASAWVPCACTTGEGVLHPYSGTGSQQLKRSGLAPDRTAKTSRARRRAPASGDRTTRPLRNVTGHRCPAPSRNDPGVRLRHRRTVGTDPG